MIEVIETKLPGVKLLIPEVYRDDRGSFMEVFNIKTAEEVGIPSVFSQDNESISSAGVLRGLHYQYPSWQGKLVRVVNGKVWDVAINIMTDSKYFGQWTGYVLSAENRHQLYIPEGYAHGFVALSDNAQVCYKCTSLYKPNEDGCIIWNDKDIGIDWPIASPQLSNKDMQGISLQEFAEKMNN